MTYDFAAIDRMRKSFEPHIIFHQGEDGFREMDVVQDDLRVILRLTSEVFSIDYCGTSSKVLVEQTIPLHEFRKLVAVLRDTLKKIDVRLTVPSPSTSLPSRPVKKPTKRSKRKSRG